MRCTNRLLTPEGRIAARAWETFRRGLPSTYQRDGYQTALLEERFFVTADDNWFNLALLYARYVRQHEEFVVDYQSVPDFQGWSYALAAASRHVGGILQVVRVKGMSSQQMATFYAFTKRVREEFPNVTYLIYVDQSPDPIAIRKALLHGTRFSSQVAGWGAP